MDDYTDVDQPVDEPSLADLNLERVSWMMRSMRRLHEQVADYERLHTAEIERLTEQHDKVIGPIRQRIEFLERQIEQFAVASYLDFGKVKFDTPHGSIRSRPTKPRVVVDDINAAHLPFVAGNTELVEYRPKVFVAPLRATLDQMEQAGTIQRIIVRADSDDYEMIEPAAEVRRPLAPGESGRWIDVSSGELLDGVTWEPNGTAGSGRNFTITLA